MIRRIILNVGIALILLLSQGVFASSGPLFNVTAIGTPAQVDITLTLNSKGPIGSQHYIVNALTVNISPTITNHVYPSAE